jgi:hypothetical protein
VTSHWSRFASLLLAIALLSVACSGADRGNPIAPGPSASSDPHAMALDGRASVVETTGRVQGFTTMRLEGAYLLAATVTLVSGETRRLIIDGGRATLRGSGLGILGRVSTITSARVEATGDAIPPKNKRSTADRAGAYPRLFVGGDFEVEGSRVLLDDKPVRGTQLLHAASGSAVLYGTLRVTSLPAAVEVVHDETGRAPRAKTGTPTFFSWRGTGDVTVGAKRIQGSPITVIASSLNAELTRRGAAFDITGAGLATQVAVAGRPQLRTTLRVNVTQPKGRFYPGLSDQLAWEQVNDGSWEAIVTEVRPLNVAARWVRLYVDKPPPLGGPGGGAALASTPGCARKVAVFAEFSLCAQFGPGRGAEEAVIFKIPARQPTGNYEARFDVIGNFPTVHLSLPMKVVPR